MEPSKLVLVGGIGRSGTSITGRLVASSRRTEFFYEPAVPFYLIDRIDNFKIEEWQRLFEISVYKDLLKNSLAGRNINLNPHDTSSITKYKSKDEIRKKHQTSYTQDELVDEAKRATAVLKVLDNIRNHDKLINLITDFYSVIVYRNPKDTINSLLKKGWFSDYQLSTESPEPARTLDIHQGKRVHQFVKESKALEEWFAMKEYDRVSHYYEWHFKKFIELAEYQNVIFVSYDNMVEDAEKTKDLIFSKMDLEEGDKTAKVVESIKPSSAIKESFEAPYSESKKKELQGLYNKLSEFAVNS